MKASELVEQLEEFSGLDPVLFVNVGGMWCPITGVDWTGQHRNGAHIKYQPINMESLSTVLDNDPDKLIAEQKKANAQAKAAKANKKS